MAPILSIPSMSVQLPPFWPADMVLWLEQIDHIFAMGCSSTYERMKIKYVCSHLKPILAAEVQDLVVEAARFGPPSYEQFKKQLICRLHVTEERKRKTQQLLEHEKMGNHTPSQFLNHLRRLAGSAILDDVVRPLWLKQLPANTRAILVTQYIDDLDKEARLADTIFHAAPRYQDTEVGGSLERIVTEMTKQMENIASTLRQEIRPLKEEITEIRRAMASMLKDSNERELLKQTKI